MNKMRMESIDMTAHNIENIGDIFSSCITEVVDADVKIKKAINFELLRQMLSDLALEGEKAYEFTWVRKLLSLNQTK